ncbi:MAG: 4'-phosphopantetheinyl transferase superfamily protein [Acidimicrobiaceae bacterium]|nr:4'-phosphopantetheinyl transferase superfamily protein [Acidimicrobiaceae bacterium]
MRVGVDVLDVAEVAHSVERFGERFLRRILSPRECDRAGESRIVTPEVVAQHFVVKEAMLKVLRVADDVPRWRDIEVELGSASVAIELSGAALRWSERARLRRIVASVSLSGGRAWGCVIGEEEE